MVTLTIHCGQAITRGSPLSVSRQHFHRSSKKFKRSPDETTSEDEALRVALTLNIDSQLDHNHNLNQHHNHNHQQQSHQISDATTNHAPDPVYLEDDQVFDNLILKESLETKQRQNNEQVLTGEMRHSLLSWMLEVCLNQNCQDDIFPFACMILDKFLLFQQPLLDIDKDDPFKLSLNEEQQFVKLGQLVENEKEFYCNEEELEQRHLYLFAACSLLLASKLRQTPRLFIQSLIKSSRDKLSVALERDEIQSGEILILSTLKWDLASLVTPNDFLTIIMRKCRKLINSSKLRGTSGKRHCEAEEEESYDENDNHNDNATDEENNGNHKHELHNDQVSAGCNESKIIEHTQKLVELCLLGKFVGCRH